MSTIDSLYQRLDRRFNAPSPLLQFAHRRKFEKILAEIDDLAPRTIVDIGRGGSVDGVVGILAAKQGYDVTITNVGTEQLEVARRFARAQGVDPSRLRFLIKNPQSCHVLPADSADLVVSLHVLEHLRDIDIGIKALRRVTKANAIIALPTCLNPCVWIRLGGGDCYRFSLTSFAALWKGLFRVGLNLRRQGILERNTLDDGTVEDHLWRYPWVMRSALKRNGFHLMRFRPDTLSLPWFKALLPLARWLDEKGHHPFLRELGYGSHAVVNKIGE